MRAEPCPIFICVWQASMYPTRLNMTFSKINNLVGQILSQPLERDSWIRSVDSYSCKLHNFWILTSARTAVSLTPNEHTHTHTDIHSSVSPSPISYKYHNSIPLSLWILRQLPLNQIIVPPPLWLRHLLISLADEPARATQSLSHFTIFLLDNLLQIRDEEKHFRYAW